MRSTRVPNPAPALRPAAPPLVRRLFSLCGVVPLGAFLVAHLAVNARALRGDAAFAGAIGAVHRLPALAWIEWALVFAPLSVPGLLGLWLLATRTPLTPLGERSPYPRGLRIAVRATGVVTVAFLAMHLSELRFRVPGARLGGAEIATLLVADLSSTWHGVPWRGAAYLAGTGCVTLHFVAGLWAFVVRTRAGEGARTRRWAGWAAAVIGAAMWLLLVNVVVFEATGARLFGGPAEEAQGSREPCPAGAVP
jgi:succinate dehydrogenase / fumarate reductase, cytochrome b subunit